MKVLYASEYIDHIEYAQILKLKDLGWVPVVVTGTPEFVDHLKNNSVEAIFFKDLSKSRVNKELRPKLLSLLKKHVPDIVYTVHGNRVTSNFRAVLSNKRFKRTPFLTYRGIIGNTNFIKNPESILTFNHPRTDGVLATSFAVKNYLQKQLLLKNKYLGVMYPGVDENFLKEKASESIDDEIFNKHHQKDKLNFCVLGTDRKSKGFTYLVEAISLLPDTIKTKIRVYYIGDPKEWEQTLKDDKSYVFLGYKKNPFKYFKKFDFMVMPSFQEGLGRASVEASMLGLPVIASNAGGLTEVIKNSQTGFVFKRCNSEELSRKISYIYKLGPQKWSALSNKMGIKSAAYMREKFIADVTVKTLISHFSALLVKKK